MEHFATINIIVAAFCIGWELSELLAIIVERVKEKKKIGGVKLTGLIIKLLCGISWMILSMSYRMLLTAA